MSSLGRFFLIVEDSETMSFLYGNVAKQLGFEVIQRAASVEQAKQMDLSEVDVVLADWSLGGMNGVDFAREVRDGKTSIRANVPILLVTGHADRKLVGEAQKAGIDGVMAKPVSAQELGKRIRAAWAARGGVPEPAAKAATK